MTKSKWIEVIEWSVLAFIAFFMIGVFLTGSDQDIGARASISQNDE
jgi:hypothetical protein